MFDLKGRVAIVTGGNGGIGLGMARGLAGAGASVVVAARNAERSKAAVRELGKLGAEALAVEVDVSDEAAVARLVQATLDRFGRIDILVNNAGTNLRKPLHEYSLAEWHHVMNTNLTSAFTLTQAALKPMIRQRSGRIICISSVVGQSGNPGQANYAASKAGLIGFAKSVALEVASRNITVNVVAPGMIATEMTDVLPEKTREALIERIPVGRLGAAEEIGAAVCFHEAMQPSFREYTDQIVANANAMATRTQEEGVRVVSGGTENHLYLIDLRSVDEDLTGKDAARLLDEIGITLNFNTIPNDPRPPYRASGLRIGTPAMTTQGMKEEQAVEVASLICQALRSRGDEKTLAGLAGRVSELAAQFTPYPADFAGHV